MNSHDEYAVQVVRYIHGELRAPESAELSRHLEVCARCRAQLAEEIALSRLFRETAPLYAAPRELHRRMAALLSQSRSSSAPQKTGPRVFYAISALRHWIARRWAPALAFAAAALLCVGISRVLLVELRARDYVEAAVAAHVASLHHELPLEVQSDDPGTVTRWVDQRVSFPFRLPASQSVPEGSSSFRLMGARLVDLKQGRGVMITYHRQNQAVTLLAASDRTATVAGGVEVQDGRLLFHYRDHDGFNVITWYNHGLAYALVSSVAGPARQSCLICHSSLPAH